MINRNNAPLVCVHWMDARHASNAWQFLCDYQVMDCVHVMTVGWLVQDGVTAKVVAQSMTDIDGDDDDVQVAGLKVIPASAVVRIELLAETEI